MAETSMALIELAEKHRDTDFMRDLGQYALRGTALRFKSSQPPKKSKAA